MALSLHAGHQVRSVLPNVAVEGVRLEQNAAVGYLSFAVLSAAPGEEQQQTGVLEDKNVRVFKNASSVPTERVESSIKLPQTFLNTVQQGRPVLKMRSRLWSVLNPVYSHDS